MWCALRCVKFGALAGAVVAGVGFGVMHLWNALVPDVFGLHALNYWQAVGLLVLTRVLFGGFRGRGCCGGSKKSLFEKRDAMSEEEREKFRMGMRGRCGC